MNSFCGFLTVTQIRHFIPLFYNLFHAFAIIAFAIISTLLIYRCYMLKMKGYACTIYLFIIIIYIFYILNRLCAKLNEILFDVSI